MVVRAYRYIIQFLILITIGIGIAISQLPDSNLHVVACNVGQGDAILIIYKNSQILIDGGPDSSVLSCLGKYVPFWDKEIELAILSHPDSDHATGMIDVVKRYEVKTIVFNDHNLSTNTGKVLKNVAGSQGVGIVNSAEGLSMRLDLIYLDIVSGFDSTNLDTNFNSIVFKLKFNEFLALFGGDIPPEVSDSIADSLGHVDYIKIPHHGSRNGLTQTLLEKTMPKVAVISVGAKNPWGFPSSEILQMLENHNVKVLRTDQMGDVEVVTDGKKIWWKTKLR